MIENIKKHYQGKSEENVSKQELNVSKRLRTFLVKTTDIAIPMSSRVITKEYRSAGRRIMK